MDHLYLLATLAGTSVAIETAEVEAVVKLVDISPVPGAATHVAGLSALRSRVLTIIDAAALIRGVPAATAAPCFAVIAEIAGHSYGVMVDSVSDICRADGGALPLRGQLDPAWAPYARGIVEHEGRPHLLLSLASFIEGPLVQAA